MPTLTTTKKPKRQKLRNAEYYGLQALQDRLYADSKDGKHFKNLVSIITSEENIQLAYRNIKKNSGSKTAGTDGKTIQDLEKWQPQTVINYVRKRLHFYIPQTVRRTEIPKPNGKMRPLGIPTLGDRLIQQCILQVLEPICEAKFHEKSFGFRPNRSTEHAIAQVYKYMQVDNLSYVVDIDIKGFFDNVNHGKLLKQMWTLGIRDKKLLCIISAMLKAEIKDVGIPEKGTPQGGILSPLLSNIVLNELDWWIASQWEEMPPKHNKPFIRKDNGKVDKGPVFLAYRERSNLKECHLVRYADDFKIFCRKRSDADKIFEATKLWLWDRLHLEISEEKSSVTNLKRHYSEYLGFQIRLHKKGKTKGGKPRYTVKSHITEKADKRIKDSLHKQIRSVQKPIGNRSGHASVECYNAYVIGVHNYYEIATHVAQDFYKISHSAHKSLRARLKKRMKRSGQYILPYIQEKYGHSQQIRYVYDTALAPIGAIKHRPPSMLRVAVNKYTPQGRAGIHSRLETVNMAVLTFLMRNPVRDRTIEFNDNRLSLYCGQCGKCAISGENLEIGHLHCHHIIPLQKGGTDKYANLVFLADRVHVLLHATREKTLNALLAELNLDKKQLAKLDKFRRLAEIPEII
ncbi:group II intron reverse transcriptase/maturase [Sinanaerobacter chloroacetimidivorans]|uniref:Group II intron reverse transcriptase/maturase n=1 Tax=Sinanaerobacter chloroacetimidivorans TaxID=2818044 RepID=A0A8J7VZD4_9FIRM|nr:group II intron reverse transcriptase/maturase [Sinanaerobacter chloroacetimidivorans]MBR0596418.1 group II intron reverse transcriptase/maturase [Sinanaerobacter chloroacetimidivorans]